MRIAEILEEMGKEEKTSLQKLIDRGLHEMSCSDVSWMDFQVAKKSAKKMQKLLEKQQVHFVLFVSQKMAESQSTETVINIVETDMTFDEISFCKEKDILLTFLYISRETKKFLK